MTIHSSPDQTIDNNSDLYYFEDLLLFLQHTKNQNIHIVDIKFKDHYHPFDIKQIQKILSNNDHKISISSSIEIPDRLMCIKRYINIIE